MEDIYKCELCGKIYLKFDYKSSIIDVHHFNLIKNVEWQTNINEDLKCLCPNCHRFVHSINDCENKSWDEIVEIFNKIQRIIN